ncbi:MAG: hypothetical protein ACW99F_03405 [Candidatus Hodarchaeales archaeon]
MTEFSRTSNDKLRNRMTTKIPEMLEAIGRIEGLDVEGVKEINSQLNWIESEVYERRVAARKEREKQNESG